MTCIVGVVDELGCVLMGCDSAAMRNFDLHLSATSKISVVGDEFLIGFTGSYRMLDLVRHAFNPPAIPANMDLDRYMATLFVDALRRCFKDGGFARCDQAQESQGGDLLVGVRGRLYGIYGDYGIVRSRENYDAVGCGAEVARGALWANTLMSAECRVEQALKAAEHFNIGVRSPFTLHLLAAYRPEAPVNG